MATMILVMVGSDELEQKAKEIQDALDAGNDIIPLLRLHSSSGQRTEPGQQTSHVEIIYRNDGVYILLCRQCVTLADLEEHILTARTIIRAYNPLTDNNLDKGSFYHFTSTTTAESCFSELQKIS